MYVTWVNQVHYYSYMQIACIRNIKDLISFVNRQYVYNLYQCD